jgi:hypothetical protein
MSSRMERGDGTWQELSRETAKSPTSPHLPSSPLSLLTLNAEQLIPDANDLEVLPPPDDRPTLDTWVWGSRGQSRHSPTAQGELYFQSLHPQSRMPILSAQRARLTHTGESMREGGTASRKGCSRPKYMFKSDARDTLWPTGFIDEKPTLLGDSTPLSLSPDTRSPSWSPDSKHFPTSNSHFSTSRPRSIPAMPESDRKRGSRTSPSSSNYLITTGAETMMTSNRARTSPNPGSLYQSVMQTPSPRVRLATADGMRSRGAKSIKIGSLLGDSRPLTHTQGGLRQGVLGQSKSLSSLPPSSPGLSHRPSTGSPTEGRTRRPGVGLQPPGSHTRQHVALKTSRNFDSPPCLWDVHDPGSFPTHAYSSPAHRRALASNGSRSPHSRGVGFEPMGWSFRD